MNSASATIDTKQDLFFQNLLALGLDVPLMSEQHRITFEKNMFCLPNQKAFEVVSHFLFMKLNEVSSKQYTIPWPLLEVKAHREFQKTCFSYLTSIAQESEIRFPTITLSVFSNFGKAFYDLYFAFTTHVVLKTNENYGCPILHRARPNPRLQKHYIRVLELSTNSAVKKFIDIAEVSQHHLETYFNCAKNLMIFVEELKITNASYEALLEDKKKNIFSLYEDKSRSEEISFDECIIKNKEYQAKIENYWTQLESFLSKEEKLWKILSTELQDEKLLLEGNQFNSSVLESLNKIDCNQNKNELWTEGKGLNLHELLKKFSCLLELYNNSILKGNFPQTCLFDLLKDNAECGANFERLKQLRDQLEKDNVLLKDSIKQLMEGFEINEDDASAIYEELPPSPSAFTNTKSVIMFDIEKYSSIKESPMEAESSLNNNKNTSNDECSYKSSPQSVCSSKDEASSSLPFELKEKLSSQEIVKEEDIAVTKKLFDDSVDLIEQEIENMINMNSVKSGTILSGNSQEFNLPESWLLEESLNSQTLGDQLSLLE